jgi:hypothetical protein
VINGRIVILSSVLVLAVGACSKASSTTTVDSATSSPTPNETTSAAPLTYSSNGVTFEYPADLIDVTSQEKFNAQTKNTGKAWGVDLGFSDLVNVVDISAYANTGVTPANLAAHKTEITNTMTNLLPNGTVTGPVDTRMGGLPGFEFDATDTLPDGTPYTSVFVLVFNDTLEYFVNCQSTTTHSAEIAAGCAEIRSTFAVG